MKISKTKHFVWTNIKVETKCEGAMYRIVPLDGIYPTCLDDTGGMIRYYFENDLVKGPDKFLVSVWEVGDNYYNFEIIMETDVPEEIFEYFDTLAEFVIENNFPENTIMTLKCS